MPGRIDVLELLVEELEAARAAHRRQAEQQRDRQERHETQWGIRAGEREEPVHPLPKPSNEPSAPGPSADRLPVSSLPKPDAGSRMWPINERRKLTMTHATTAHEAMTIEGHAVDGVSLSEAA